MPTNKVRADHHFVGAHRDRGRFVGVAGVDITLDGIQDIVQAIRIYEMGYASLLSNQSIYVAAKDRSNCVSLPTPARWAVQRSIANPAYCRAWRAECGIVGKRP